MFWDACGSVGGCSAAKRQHCHTSYQSILETTTHEHDSEHGAYGDEGYETSFCGDLDAAAVRYGVVCQDITGCH